MTISKDGYAKYIQYSRHSERKRALLIVNYGSTNSYDAGSDALYKYTDSEDREAMKLVDYVIVYKAKSKSFITLKGRDSLLDDFFIDCYDDRLYLRKLYKLFEMKTPSKPIDVVSRMSEMLINKYKLKVYIRVQKIYDTKDLIG